MDLKNQSVLFFARTMQAGGTENVVLRLCEIFKPLVKKIVVCSGGGVNVDKLAAMDVKHYQFPDIECKNPFIMFRVIYRLKSIVKKEGITIIHTHHRMAAFYVSVLGLYRKYIFINTSHNVFLNKKRLTRFAYKNGNLIACGRKVRDNLVEFFGLAEEQVEVIHNTVKPFLENVKAEELIKELHNAGYYLVGNIGRLSEQKGMEYFIRAIPKVLEKHENARFLIIGSGEEEERLKSLAEKVGAGQYLFFMGYREDAQNLMAQLDLIVLSSLWEGLPLTPIEAYSVGKTIVATAVDGTAEIVRDAIDGFLVPACDAISIADRINYLMDNKLVQRELEKHALEKYYGEYSFEEFSKSYVAYYKGL